MYLFVLSVSSSRFLWVGLFRFSTTLCGVSRNVLREYHALSTRARGKFTIPDKSTGMVAVEAGFVMLNLLKCLRFQGFEVAGYGRLRDILRTKLGLFGDILRHFQH